MSEFSEITQIYNTESSERLKKARDDEILKIHKLELIISILKSVKHKNLVGVDQDTFKRHLEILSIQNFIKIAESNNVLNLNKHKVVELSYTERKAVREFVVGKVKEICTPIVEYVKSTEIQSPELLNPAVGQDEIIQLEDKRRKAQTELVRVKNEKCILLKSCAELKLGPYLRNELELVHTSCRLNQVKANLLQNFLVHDFCTRTEYTVKAIKEVENYIDAKLEDE